MIACRFIESEAVDSWSTRFIEFVFPGFCCPSPCVHFSAVIFWFNGWVAALMWRHRWGNYCSEQCHTCVCVFVWLGRYTLSLDESTTSGESVWRRQVTVGGVIQIGVAASGLWTGRRFRGSLFYWRWSTTWEEWWCTNFAGFLKSLLCDVFNDAVVTVKQSMLDIVHI